MQQTQPGLLLHREGQKFRSRKNLFGRGGPHQRIFAHAKDHITLTCGGGYIRISGGNIEAHCPELLEVKAGSYSITGPMSLEISTKTWPNFDPYPTNGKATQRVILSDQDGYILKNRPYRVWMKDGSVVDGITDKDGTTDLLISESKKVATIELLKRHF